MVRAPRGGHEGVAAADASGRRCRIQRTGVEVSLAIGTLDVLLHPAQVTMQRIALIGGDCCVGNVGRDLLAQRSAIVIDLSTMTLRLE